MGKGTAQSKKHEKKSTAQGKLRIGDQWNAIRIIALSQSNPLKAIAELVENSIDAGARRITVVRGKERGNQFLRVVDDGQGIDDLSYVATHIGDSIKRRLKAQGLENIQGEFGIGLLSFWTLGEELVLSSMGSDGRVRKLHMVKENPAYDIRSSRELFDRPGTTVTIAPLLPGVRYLGAEKIQSYLASELRDRIRNAGVEIRIVDRRARKDLLVEPRRFAGTLIHGLPACITPYGEAYIELYLTDPASSTGIDLYRNGTRVIEDITEVETFRTHPWTSHYLEGVIDVPFVNLTPGTRSGIVHDERLEALHHALHAVVEVLTERIEEQRRAEEEAASRSMLRKITRALRDAISMLPPEDYGWLSAKTQGHQSTGKGRDVTGAEDAGGSSNGENGADDDGNSAQLADDAGAEGSSGQEIAAADTPEGSEAALGTAEAPREQEERTDRQRAFFEFPGPLYRLELRPASSVVSVEGTRKLHAVPKDKSRRAIDEGVDISWEIIQGAGSLDTVRGEFAEYRAPAEPELAILRATASSSEIEATAEARITVTAELIPQRGRSAARDNTGLPGYTYRYAAGELWRSRYDVEAGIITINSAHPDFIFAARQKASKLRYVAQLFAKEIVLANFPGAPPQELLERMVELNLYMEQNLR